MNGRSLCYQEYLPHPELRQFVKCYWAIETSSDSARTPHGVIPGGHTDIVFNLGETVLDETGAVFTEGGKAFLVGPYHSFHRFQANGRFQYFGVRFYSGKAPLSHRFPLWRVRNQAVALDSIKNIEPCFSHVPEFTKELSTQPNGTRIAMLNRLLRSHCDRWRDPDPDVCQALRLIERSGGQISVDSLSEMLRVTTRRLERKFARHVGLSPKAYCRVIRFRDVRSIVSSAEGLSGVRVAYSCGYSDQTHFIRDFRWFTGKTPSCFEHSRSVGFFLYEGGASG